VTTHLRTKRLQQTSPLPARDNPIRVAAGKLANDPKAFKKIAASGANFWRTDGQTGYSWRDGAVA
jgi:hypothetical protein